MLLKNLYLRPGSVVSAKVRTHHNGTGVEKVLISAQVEILYEVSNSAESTTVTYETEEEAQSALQYLHKQNTYPVIPV